MVRDFTAGHIRDWDTSLVENFYNLFKGKTQFNDDVSKWQTSKVTFICMDSMFEQAHVFNVALKDCDVGRVMDFGPAFYVCRRFEADLSKW